MSEDRLEGVLRAAADCGERLRVAAARAPADPVWVCAVERAATSGPHRSPALVRTVEGGRATWAQVWADPLAWGPEAVAVVRAAVVATVREAAERAG